LNLTRLITAHRPSVILAVLVSLSLASLVTGTETTFIQTGIKRLVSLTAYPFLKVRFGIEAGVDHVFGVVFDYQALRVENGQLTQDVMTLKQELVRRAEISAENERLRGLLGFVRAEPKITFMPVRVIESMRGMLTIDRGAVHGLEKAMCVVTRDGVVGVITEVLDLSAKVATLHHQDCRIGAMVQRGRLRAYDGVLHASGDFGRVCTLRYIDMGIDRDEVRVGDVVVTSPESVFPSGYPIGTIRMVYERGGLLKEAEVVPFVDPYRLDEALVVWQALPPAEELTGPIAVREAVSEAPPVPDRRPVHERYAP
jgi:rod shape-determining protein MreC